eukprot:5322568-Prorocentrum_lima.AAC.1
MSVTGRVECSVSRMSRSLTGSMSRMYFLKSLRRMTPTPVEKGDGGCLGTVSGEPEKNQVKRDLDALLT